MKIPIHTCLTPNFDSIKTFLEGFKITPLIADSPPDCTDHIFPMVEQFIRAVEREFPGGIPTEEGSRERLEGVYDDIDPKIKQLALRSFVPNLAFYTDACLHRKALASAFSDLVTAMMECFPPEMAKQNPAILKFVTKAHAVSAKLKVILGMKEDGGDDCQCPACVLRRAVMAKPKPKCVVEVLDPNDPDLPGEVKDVIQKVKGGNPEDPLVKSLTMQINYTKPAEWDDALRQFPEAARPEILKQLRKFYHKATGKYAPGDPALKNN